MAGKMPRTCAEDGREASKEGPPGMDTNPEALRPEPWRQHPWSEEVQAWAAASDAVPAEAAGAELAALPGSCAVSELFGQQACSGETAIGAASATETAATALRNQVPSLQHPETWAWTNTATSRMLRQENQEV